LLTCLTTLLAVPLALVLALVLVLVLDLGPLQALEIQKELTSLAVEHKVRPFLSPTPLPHRPLPSRPSHTTPQHTTPHHTTQVINEHKGKSVYQRQIEPLVNPKVPEPTMS